MAATTALAPDLANWNPEDESTWDKKLAWRTLWITTYNLTLAFCVWYLVSAVAPRLNVIGYDLSKEQLYWLVAIPGLAGGLFRMAYTFLPPMLGTRTLVGGTATLMLLPMAGWTLAVRDPSTPYPVLLLLAVAAGIGGGAFAGFMPSTSYFFPKRMAGTALGLQAGLGNFGVSLIQFLVPWVIGFGLLGTAALTPQQKAEGGQMWLLQLQINEYPWANRYNHEPKRTRRLLLHRKEIDDLGDAVKVEGYTLLPLEVYLKKGRIKVLLGLCKGKKVHDKRAAERERDDRREMDRAMRRR